MLVELKRVFDVVGRRSKGRIIAEFIVLPLFVASIMLVGYLLRAEAKSYCENFIFFGTLYAFWCGLFASCQAFNGEVASGEWSYWVLGLNRNRIYHYFSHFVVSMIVALFQVVVCLIFIRILWEIAYRAPFLKGFYYGGGTFVGDVVSLFDPGHLYNLNKLNTLFVEKCNAKHLWFVFCIKYYLFGLFGAVLAGCSIGLLISALCSTPQASLTAAVALVVACTILSHTGMLGKNTNSSKKIREFAPIALITMQAGDEFDTYAKDNKTQTRFHDGGIIEQMSFILPQRYFYNIAALPTLKFEYSLGNWNDNKDLKSHTEKIKCGQPVNFCKCPVCIGLITASGNYNRCIITDSGIKYGIGEMEDTHWAVLDTDDWFNKMRIEKYSIVTNYGGISTNYIKGYKEAVRRNHIGIRSLLGFLDRVTIIEFTAIFIIFLISSIVSIFTITTGGKYNELR